ncbi:MAG: hypothetical protein ING89_14025 [Rubrivivax sp.]|nr:hypothetical protein [Rubrivivax sp.]
MPLQIDRALLILCATGALAGCAQWPAVEPGNSTPVPAPVVVPAPAPAPAPEAPAVTAPPPMLPPAAEAAQARLLAWQDRLRELPGAELAREVARRDPPADAAASVELALALAYTRTLAQAAGTPANGELARALALLEPVGRTASPWQAPARLLQSRLAEQRRLEDQIDKLQQQLREQQRRNEQLAAQIEALRAIERSLGSARPPAPPAPR